MTRARDNIEEGCQIDLFFVRRTLGLIAMGGALAVHVTEIVRALKISKVNSGDVDRVVDIPEAYKAVRKRY